MRSAVLALLFAAVGAGQDAPPEPRTDEFASPPAEPPVPKRDAGIGRPGNFGMGGSPGYLASWYPTRPVAGSGLDLGIVRQSLSGGYPVWKDEGNTLLTTAGLRYTRFDTDAVLPDTGRPFPADLWDLNAGLMYIRKFENGWTGAAFVRGGSASDRPFHSFDELYASAGGFLTVPAANDRDSWLFAFFYSSAGSLNFPVPGLAYVWNPTPEWRVTLGIPFAVQWRPTEDWTVDLSYLPLTNINARATYRVGERWSVFAGYEFQSEAYFLADRLHVRDRFFVLEQRIVGGARWNLSERWSLDFQGGYAFERDFGEGDGQNDLTRDRLSVAAGAFAGLNLRFGF
ncbi:MAG TPA: DUF6268 family outer membrane beta-barrel protein [Gemmataceae bacterium]|jgi:hypothetical protein|nr:DUF6268 family outer membrane beta-barrel protein [Gemmataceae bacterium]